MLKTSTSMIWNKYHNTVDHRIHTSWRQVVGPRRYLTLLWSMITWHMPMNCSTMLLKGFTPPQSTSPALAIKSIASETLNRRSTLDSSAITGFTDVDGALLHHNQEGFSLPFPSNTCIDTY
jgi:hypothetical protein